MSFSVEVHDDNKVEEEEEGFNSSNFMSRIQRRMNGTQRLRTDQKGKLVVDAIAGTTGSVRLKDTESSRGWGRDEQPPLAEVLFESLKAGEQRDMGDITLDRGPLLVSGKVINSAGEPVAGVRLSVTVTEVSTQNSEEQRGRGGFGRRGGNGSTRLSVRTKNDGTFLAHRLVDLLAVGRISLSDRKWTMADHSFNPGDENLLITAVRGGTLVGRATKSDPNLIGSLSISATLADSSSESEGGRRGRRGRPRGMARTKPDGTYTIENLAPGTYNLRITMNSMEAFAQDGLRVYEGQETSVPPVVVGDGFLMGEVLVVDADGQPLKDVRVSISTGSNGGNRWSSRGWGRSSTRTNEQGSALALIPSGSEFTVSVSSGRLRLSKTVNSSGFPLRLNMKDAQQPEPRRGGRSGIDADTLREFQSRRRRGGNR
jgi:protocatechuate 3,4-dioxygenase beta subunit